MTSTKPQVTRGARLEIGILGAGITGLCLAERLSAQGHAVTVFERGAQIGGLAIAHDFGSFIWDRFYHVILPSDIALLDYLGKIGLGGEVRWKNTRTGFYIDGQTHSLSNSWEFLRFPALNLVDKVRLAICIAYCAHRKDGLALENTPVDVWLTKLCGKTTYKKIWQPLLIARLGLGYRDVSAVFIWSYIRRMYSVRHSGAQKETLGHVVGGYHTVLNRLQSLLTEKGAVLATNTLVTEITTGDNRGVEVTLTTHDNEPARQQIFDKFVYTGPSDLLKRVAGPDMVTHDEADKVNYLGVLCPAVVTRTPLTPFYVTNIADSTIPFTGVIGMSNVVDVDETNGRYLTYFPKYIPADDPGFELSDEEVVSSTLKGLRRMFPEFDMSGIERVQVNRASHVQPLQTVGYSKRLSTLRSRHPDLLVLNTSQLVTNTVNNDAAIRGVFEFLRKHRDHFGPADRVGAS